MQVFGLVKSLGSACSPFLKTLLWLGGIITILIGIITWLWWPFATVISLTLYIRLPAPLGMIPPIFDSASNALIVSMTSLLGFLALLLAFLYMKLVWLLPAILFFGKSIKYYYDIGRLKEKFRQLDLSVSIRSDPIYSLMPLLVRIHPYFLCLYKKNEDLGGGVRIRRITPMDTSTPMQQLSSSIDIWYKEEVIHAEEPTVTMASSEDNSDSVPTIIGPEEKRDVKKKKPLFFFIHGGGWKGGGSKRHTQATILHRLVLNGYTVVACNYRKDIWPHHFDDCYRALLYVIQEAEEFDIDVENIVISGASAGGHLGAC